MTLSEQEAEKYAEELVKLSIDVKQTRERIKSIKDALMEYVDVEQLPSKVWQCDNGYVDFHIETKYKLADVPATVEVDPQVVAIDTAAKAFKSKVTLSKEGKKMFEEGERSIVKLMIPSDKKVLKVEV